MQKFEGFQDVIVPRDILGEKLKSIEGGRFKQACTCTDGCHDGDTFANR